MKAVVIGLAGLLVASGGFATTEDIQVNRPDFVVFVPRHELPKKSDKLTPERLRETGDTYNDHFQVIEDAQRRLLYAFWTQATWEGCEDQHIAFSKSADKGRTWSEPVVLAGSSCRAFPKLRASWQQPMLAKTGRLYCLWNQQTTSRRPHCGQMFGVYSDDAGETWKGLQQVPFAKRMDQDDADPLVPPYWCNWQRPLRIGKDGRFFVGCSRHGKAPYDRKWACKIEFWEFLNIDENPSVGEIRFDQFATNRDMLSPEKVEPVPGITYFVPREDPAVEEAAIVKLPDGRLFALMRSSLGCPVWSQSRDGGRTWSGPKALLDAMGKPIPHPRSPCPLYDWKGPEAGSGTYFAFVHMKFDFTAKTAYQTRGPLYLIAGTFDPKGEQPIRFAAPKLFAPRQENNSFYTSYTVLDGEGVLWFNDRKYYLLGRKIGPEWIQGMPSDRQLGASGAPDVSFFAVSAQDAASVGAATQDERTVVFLGDSITHQNIWPTFVERYLIEHNPDCRYRFVNAGVGGDTAKNCQNRLHEDVAPYNPDTIVIMFGMNDLKGCLWADPFGEKEEARAKEQLADYAQNLRNLRARLLKDTPGARLVWCTPSIYDDTAALALPCYSNRNTIVLHRAAGIVKALGRETGDKVVDFNGPMTAWNLEHQKTNPRYSLVAVTDRTHPGVPGAFFMACEFLKQTGHDPEAADPTVPWPPSPVSRLLAERDKFVQRERFLSMIRWYLRQQDTISDIDDMKQVEAFARKVEKSNGYFDVRVKTYIAEWRKGSREEIRAGLERIDAKIARVCSEGVSTGK